MTCSTLVRPGRFGRAAVLGCALAALVAGCSAAGSSVTSEATGQPAERVVAGAEAGAAAPADAAAAPAGAATATDRQVVTTGALTLVAPHPTTTVDAVVRLIERAGGRVDSRDEQAATADFPGAAKLTVRLPATTVTGTIDELRALGTVADLTLQAQDVTAAAQDLDARIDAQRISVARLEQVLSRAATTSDVVAAEDALRQRQSDLESMVAERARIADQVALSTLTITLSAPSLVAATGPSSFTTALGAGWHSLVSGLRSVILVVGLLLPWLAFLALLAAPVLWLVHRRRPVPVSAPEPASVGRSAT
jgi:hypothetical protein